MFGERKATWQKRRWNGEDPIPWIGYYKFRDVPNAPVYYKLSEIEDAQDISRTIYCIFLYGACGAVCRSALRVAHRT